ncbi:mitochondrial amidoxime reducing component 2-like [Calliphora vicina]|uniref:mitochondrial amidoxime reducing component 2-like n=1 Tax=Calliphora vicina TaxID=7373 RepID=UPI00325B3952
MKSYLLSTVLAASLGAIALSYISYYICRRKHLQKPPKNAKWEFVGTLEEIVIYPVTSAAPLLLNEVQCKIDGLYSEDLRDRCLVLIDENGKYAFAGVYPKMLSITTEVGYKNTLVVKAPEMESLTINLDSLKMKHPIVKHKQGCKSHLVEGEQEHHEWFSKVIMNKSQGLKLFLIINTEFEYNLMGEDKSEFIPVMVMNNKSVNDLNKRLTTDDRVHHLQFRGNVLIDTLENVKPYAEDNWSWIRIGEEKENAAKNCILRYHAPCLRCILPNVDIKTCKRNPNFEPLNTLKKYRLIHNKKEPTMGAYYKVYQEGSFKTKDPVYAIIT